MKDNLLKSSAYWVINQMLAMRGLKLPYYFYLRQRLCVLGPGIEPDLFAFCSKNLKPGMVVLDVGANVGLLTRAFCRVVGPQGKVIAFEPDPVTFECLAHNTRKCPNVRVVAAAASDNNDTATFFIASSGTSNSLLIQKDSVKSIAVPCIKLDDWLPNQKIDHVDLVKIDVEGGELKVLRGMQKTVLANPQLGLIVEYCPKNQRDAGLDPQSLYHELVEKLGRIEAIQPDGSVITIEDFKKLESCLNLSGYTNLFCRHRTA